MKKVEIINIVIIGTEVRIISPYPTEKAIEMLKDIIESGIKIEGELQ